MKYLLISAHVAVVVMLASCSLFTPNALKVVAFRPAGETATTSIVEVAFSRGVVTPESTNVWTTTPFLEFEPPIEGKFVWQDSARLVFSPDAPLPGDTKFKARLNSNIIASRAGVSSISGTESFSFATFPFRMKSGEFFYDRIDNKRTVGVRANFEFTYKVNPEEMGKNLIIKIDGERHSTFKVMSNVPATIVPVEIGSLLQIEMPKKIEISFEDEFTSPETQTRITMNDPFRYTLPGLEVLKIYGHEIGFDGSTGWIRIQTSQEVDIASVKNFVSVEPPQKFEIEPGDRSGFVIRGRFNTEQPYALLIKKGLESVIGAKTENDYTADIVIGNMKPSFRFSSEGTYMLLGGARSVGFTTVNIESVKVRVSQIFQNNIVFFLSEGRQYDWYYDEEQGSTHKYRFNVGNYGRQLDYTTATIANKPNQQVTTMFDVSPYIRTDFKGFLLLEIAQPGDSWRTTSKLVSISDIGLIVKQSGQDFNVFAVSLETNEPIKGVNVQLVSTSNQTIATRPTDGDGYANFSGLGDLAEQFTVKLVTASKGDDFNYINLDDYRVETSRFDVGGKYESKAVLDAFLYGDRNLYRPGETIVVSGVVRTLGSAPPKDLPVRVKISNPRGTLVSEQIKNLNAQGSFEATYASSMTSLTGDYTVELLTGDGIFLASRSVSVEDFVPDRLRVSITPDSKVVDPGGQVTFNFQALNFFGPPAAGRNYEFEATFQDAAYISKQFPSFRFADDEAPDVNETPVVVEGKTDPDGKGTAKVELRRGLQASGTVRVRGRVGVFDESGRPVYQVAPVIMHPKEYHIGVSYEGGYYVPPQTPQKIKVVAVDVNDKQITAFKVRADLIRREWHSVLRMDANNRSLRYVSERKDVMVSQTEVELKEGATEIPFTVPRSGDYALRVSKVKDGGYNEITFYSYGWESADLTSFRVDPEAKVEIIPDKKVYEPGEHARLLFQTPFSGTMLVTVERNKVYTYEYVKVEKNSASIEIPVEDEYLPNAYVSAVLFRKVKDQNIPLMAGHGVMPLMVERKSNHLNVTISAPEKMRPKRKQTVTVSVPNESDVFVTVAAVDEGILQIKSMLTPDPYGHFYTKKALQTQTFDFFRDLLPEPERKVASAVGGGDESMMAKRVNPLSVQRFKPVSLWSGIVQTNGDGKAEVTLDIPEFSGELRLMAVAYKNDRFGSAERPMTVSDPVVITPALPRFASPNDNFIMPITAFNTTDKPVSLKFAIDTKGPLTATEPTASLTVGANEERFVNVSMRATGDVGKAVVNVKATVLGEEVSSTTEMPVRPTSPFTTESVSGFVDGGKTVNHNLTDVFLPFGRKAYATISPFPVVGFAKQLKHLVGYPHGCLEQTTSRAFPQIYLRDLALLLDPSILNQGSPAYFVNEAIRKIASMQMEDGTFSYWPGGGNSNEWSTVYATHFLVEANKAGYAVPEATLKNALRAITQTARNKRTVDYTIYERNKTVVKRIADKTSVYALYILALAGQAEKPLMNFYRTAPDLLTVDTRTLLAGSFSLSGDRKTALEILPAQFVTEEPARMSGYWFDSPIRANAIILNVLLETDPENVNILRYMEYLTNAYGRYYWYSTQDNAFTLLGFGKAARKAGTGKTTGTLRMGGKEFSYKGGNEKIELPSAEGSVSFTAVGDGRVYYSIVTEGIRKDGSVNIEDKNLRVRREFFDRHGNAVGLDGVKQNSLVIVRITLQSDVDRLENVAITDLLPAGFEIENSRLTETSEYRFLENVDTPTYSDIRDDRINMYTDFWSGERRKTFSYMVRAVTKGTFQYAPIAAEAMYDGNYSSAYGWGTVRVVD